MKAKDYLLENGYKDGMIWTLDNVAKVCEEFSNRLEQQVIQSCSSNDLLAEMCLTFERIKQCGEDWKADGQIDKYYATNYILESRCIIPSELKNYLDKNSKQTV